MEQNFNEVLSENEKKKNKQQQRIPLPCRPVHPWSRKIPHVAEELSPGSGCGEVQSQPSGCQRNYSEDSEVKSRRSTTRMALEPHMTERRMQTQSPRSEVDIPPPRAPKLGDSKDFPGGS